MNPSEKKRPYLYALGRAVERRGNNKKAEEEENGWPCDEFVKAGMGRHDHLEYPGALKKIDYPQLFSKVLHQLLIRKIEIGAGKWKETLFWGVWASWSRRKNWGTLIVHSKPYTETR